MTKNPICAAVEHHQYSVSVSFLSAFVFIIASP